MTVYAKLGRDGSAIQCGKCSVKLADQVEGPLERMVAERGGPALGTVVVPSGQRTVLMVAGYLPRDDLDGLWVRSKRGKFAHGDARNGVLEFPARALCFRCGEECVLDLRRLGLTTR